MRARQATAADSALLLEWRNDPVTRQWSIDRSAVAPADHERWLASVLADPGRHLLVVEAPTPVGVVRFDSCGEGEFEVSITVAPSARGRGIARPVLTAGHEWLRGEAGPTRVLARVRTGNAASWRLFEGAGYTPVSSDDEFGLLAVDLT